MGTQDLGLTEAEFWDLTPREYRARVDRHEELLRREDWRFGVLAELVASVAGNKKSTGQPYRAHDFFPSLQPVLDVVPLRPRPGPVPQTKKMDAIAAAFVGWAEDARATAYRRGMPVT